MNNVIIYFLTIIIWGTTWFAIKFQIGDVDPIVSVVYRFGLASTVLMLYCFVRRLKMNFSLKDHVFMFLQGVFLFSFNYWLVYIAEISLTSGLVAVVYSTLMFMNVFNGFFFIGTPIRSSMILGSIIGVLGVGLIFWPEVSVFDFSDKNLLSLLLGLVSVFLASLGNIISARNQKHKLPVMQNNAFSMAYGTIVLLLVALIAQKTFSFPKTWEYIGALAYLSFFGSVIAFWLYLTLLGRIGADRAAYAIILVPVIALVVSTFFEGYKWTLPSIAGIILVICGNAVLLQNRKSKV